MFIRTPCPTGIVDVLDVAVGLATRSDRVLSINALPRNMDPTPPLPAPKLFDLTGKNVLLTGGTRGARLPIYLYF